MKVMVTGNLGYIGSVLTPLLSSKGYSVIGYDTGFYEDCLLYEPRNPEIFQIRKDIRNIASKDLKGVEAIVHLAALSNDPLGNFSPKLTEEINLNATIKIAELAKKAGVRRFVYASSQSMYGIADTSKEVEEDNSEKNPLTEYARTKWEAECALKKMGDDRFTVVCFRPSTVFGASPRLRCDIVFNNLVGCAFSTGRIEIKSDGSPWRPVVHVKDVCSAFLSGLEAPESIVSGESFNVGLPNGNFRVRELAEAAQKSVPGSSLVFTNEHNKDNRTYRVSFKKILSTLSDYFKPEWTLDRGGVELYKLFESCNFSEPDFRGRKCTRLSQLQYLIDEGRIDKNFYWQ